MPLDPSTLIFWALMAGAAVAVVVFTLSFFQHAKRLKRIQTVLNKRRGELSRQQLESLNKPSSIRERKKSSYIETLNKLIRALKMQGLLSSDSIKVTLAQAGFRGRTAVVIYISARIAGVFIGFFLVYFMIDFSWKDFPYPGFMKLVFAGVGSIAGFFFPKLLMTNSMQKRQHDMNLAFPDALDLLVICVEAGLSVEQSFAKVTEEIAEASEILAQELGLTSAELAYLGERRQAYENFSIRTGLPAAKSLATTLIQSEKYGTPVGAALRILSQEKRDERMSAAEKKAASLPAKLSVPMIIFFLPVLFLVVIGPAVIQVMGMK